jgi:hypothetical protein
MNAAQPVYMELVDFVALAQPRKKWLISDHPPTRKGELRSCWNVSANRS